MIIFSRKPEQQITRRTGRGIDALEIASQTTSGTAKAAYNRRLIDESGGDPKTFWKTMKKVLPGEKRATSPNVSVNGSVTSDKRCIANAFKKFFASAATPLMSV